MRLKNVRIPRGWMLMKNQKVDPEGNYTRRNTGKDGKGKMQYSTMLMIRAGLVMSAGYKLMQGVVIVTRYSCVRQQGFKSNEDAKRMSSEHSILNYQNQQYRVFKQMSNAFAMIFAGNHLSKKFEKIQIAMASDENQNVDLSDLPEIHAMSSGLKALCTVLAANGLEECRKCCGGHGVLLASGVAQLAVDNVTYVTAEGDHLILELQSAKFLVKCWKKAQDGEDVSNAVKYLKKYTTNHEKCKAFTAAEFESNFLILISAFQRRAQISVNRASSRYITELTKQSNELDAWNNCSLDLVHASRSHCHLMMLQSFVSEVNSVENAEVQAVLRNICALYALIHMQEFSGDFGVGYFSDNQQNAIREAIRNILKTIRPNAVAITDSFEFPDNVLNSALGKHDGNVYESLYRAARANPLSKQDPFIGYDKVLRPHLDLDFIKEHASMMRQAPLNLISKI